MSDVAFAVLLVSWGLVALMVILIVAVWPNVRNETWNWTIIVVGLAVFNTARIALGV